MSETQAPLVLLLDRSRGWSSGFAQMATSLAQAGRQGMPLPRRCALALPHQPQGKLGDVVFVLGNQ